MDDRTVTLSITDWERIKAILNADGATTEAIDKLIFGDNQRPSLTRSWDWWSGLIDRLGNKNYGLSIKIIAQCSRAGTGKPLPVPNKYEVDYARGYLAQDDDRELPEMDATT